MGREVINSGTNIINDIRNNVTPEVALKTRSREGVANLVKKAMHGDGYKRRILPKKRHSSKVIHSSNIKRRKITKNKKPVSKKKKKKKSKDIFS